MIEEMKELKKAVVLLSGGLDSTTVLAYAANKGFALFALSFDYGQKNRFELEKASVIAAQLGAAEHKKVFIDLRAFGGSSLTTAAPIERGRSLEQIGKGIPQTYVPARNVIFLSYALAWADVLGAEDIFIGVNAVDSSGYPDCRPAFIAAFEETANRALRLTAEGGKIRIIAPLQHMSKADIIKLGVSLGVDYSLTNTCYDPLPGGKPCRGCDACILREKGFREAGIPDPLFAA